MSLPEPTRRQFLLATLSGAGALALSACGSAATTSPPASATVSSVTAAPIRTAAASAATATTATGTGKATTLGITYFSAGNTGTSVDYFEQNAMGFSTAHPNVQVEIVPVTGDYDTKVLTMAAAGTPPDVVLQGGRDFGLFVTKGVVLDLSPLIARDHYDTSDFFDVCMQLTTWQNKVYGLPDDFNVLGLYYNRDLLQKAGVGDPPTDWAASGWTWNDFLDTAKRLTVSSGGQNTQFGTDLGFDPTGAAPIVWSYGGDYLNQDWTRCLMDQPAAISALQFLQDVVKAQVKPTSDDLKKEDANHRWYAGQTAMRVAGAFFSNPSSQNIKGFTWDVAVLPSGPAGRFSATGGTQGSSWSVASASKRQEDAWQLTQWMASVPSLTTLSEHGWIGARKSVGYSKAYLDPTRPPAHRKVFVDATLHAKVIPLVPNWSDVNTALSKDFGYLQDGTKSPQDVGAAMVHDVDALLSQH